METATPTPIPAGVPMARTFDLGMVRANAGRAREDAEMIVSLSDALANMAKENTELRAKLAALTPTPTEGNANAGQ